MSELVFVKIWFDNLGMIPLITIRKDDWNSLGGTFSSDGDLKIYINGAAVVDYVIVRKINKWKLWSGDLQLITLEDVADKFTPWVGL